METTTQELDYKSATMSISELSQMSGFNKSTIQHYLKLGLLPNPTKVRPNLCVYTDTHLKVLKRIQQIKETEGLSLGKLKEMLDKGLLGCDEGMGPDANARPDDLQMETEVVDLHQAKRLQIIDKSITLFSKFGFEAVKISDITDALQMGKGTFYLYFTNKRELLLACFDRLQALLLPLEMWDVVRNEKDIFLKLLHRWTGGNERYSSFSGVLSLIRTSCSWDEDEVKEKARRAYDVIIAPIRRDLEEAVAKGIVRPMDEELTAYAVLGIMEGLSFRLTLDSRYSAKEGADFIYPFLISALRADKTGQTRDNKAPAISVKITDINGVAIELSEVRFNDSEHFSGKYGDAEIKVEPLQLKAIKVDSSDSRTLARLTAKDGHDLELEIDGDTLIKGYTSFGGLQIAFRKVSQLVFI